jgi:uncharacterized protein (TIGR01777 family)
VSKILITGGTGLVGTYLTRELLLLGHEVVFLSRKPGMKNGIRLYEWDIDKGYIDEKALEGIDAVINLAGAGIADKRWTRQYKEELYNSRVLSTRLLVSYIHKGIFSPGVFVSASAIGIYGDDTHQKADETASPAVNFLAELCSDWEHEASSVKDSRLVIIRTGIVLARDSGFIPKLSKPIRYGAGAVLVTGRQMISWIHIHDLVNIYLKAIADENLNGIYNGVSPGPENNKTITLAMAKKLNRKILLPPVPAIALKVLFGELSSTLVANQNVSSLKIEKTGFRFTYPTLQKALDDLM